MQVTMEPIYTLLPRMRNYIYGNIEGEKATTLKYHQLILEAIANQEADVASSVMRDHLVRTREIFDRYMNNNNS